MALQVTARGVSTSSHFQEKVLLFSQHLDNAFVLHNASFVPIWHCFEWQSKRCNYLHLFFILHIPPPLFLWFAEIVCVCPREGRRGSQPLQWGRCSAHPPGECHTAAGDLVKVTRGDSNKSGCHKRSLWDPAQPQQQLSPKPASSRNHFTEFGSSDALSITFLMSPGNTSVQIWRLPWIQVHVTTLQVQSRLVVVRGREDWVGCMSGRTGEQSLRARCSINRSQHPHAGARFPSAWWKNSKEGARANGMHLLGKRFQAPHNTLADRGI